MDDEMPSHSRTTNRNLDHDIVDDDLMHAHSGRQRQDDHDFVVQMGSNTENQRLEVDQNSNPTFPDSHGLVERQEVVSMTGNNENDLLNLNSADHEIQVLANSSIATMTDDSGAIYLLVANDTSGNIVHTSPETSVNIISSDVLKEIGPNSNSTVQIMNTEGIPVNINVNDLLSSINASKAPPLKDDSSPPDTAQSILNFSPITSTRGPHNITCDRDIGVAHTSDQYIPQHNVNRLLSIPSWALHLQDCTLYGDTYTGYVTDEIEMDNALNLYKKETQSLFAIRQTPSSKDESTDTVRLMWKSQYVPYDGIPFVNVGRRAIVMECEYGPRKRNNALKRMIQLHGHEKAIAKIPNLTCPARLFVKKVRKFPQFRVPSDADPKVLRQLQEQSLKLVRQQGFQTGEIRFYMQLPLPSAHRYHHVGVSLEAFQKELENSEHLIIDSLSVDSRVLEKIQEIVRQGFVNPFLVRAALKDFVENQMELGSLEQLPDKHNKEFYPPLIEIQNIIQQTQAALNSGLLTPLPAPPLPPVSQKPKRKRSGSDSLLNSSLLIKKMSIDTKKETDGMVSPTIPSEIVSGPHTKNVLNDSMISVPDAETISLTLTDSQLEHFSVSNFSYNQLAQLAKIGLLALNNATKDPTPMNVVGDEMGVKSVCDKDISTLVNAPLPECEPNKPLLMNENIDVKDEKIGILSDMNELNTNEITVNVVQYK